MAGGGARSLRLRSTRLVRDDADRVMVREITLFQRSDDHYTLSITEYDEARPKYATVSDTDLQCSRADAIAAFEEAVAESKAAGWTESA